MKSISLYRKRYIPNECILLKGDEIVSLDENCLITKWKTINPKAYMCRGCSCYFFKEGFKLSKIYDFNDNLLYWYCDIVEFTWDEETSSLTSIDLLADVVIYPDGAVKVVDLDELAKAHEDGLITTDQLHKALYQTNHLLTYIHENRFCELQAKIENLGL